MLACNTDTKDRHLKKENFHQQQNDQMCTVTVRDKTIVLIDLISPNVTKWPNTTRLKA